VQKLSGAVFCTRTTAEKLTVLYQIRRSAEIKRSGFLHTHECGKTDGIVSNQWGIGISSPEFCLCTDLSLSKHEHAKCCCFVLFVFFVAKKRHSPNFESSLVSVQDNKMPGSKGSMGLPMP